MKNPELQMGNTLNESGLPTNGRDELLAETNADTSRNGNGVASIRIKKVGTREELVLEV